MKLLSFRGPDGLARVGVLVDGQVRDIDDQLAALPLPGALLAHLAQQGLAPAAGGMLRLLQAGPAALARLVLPAGGLALDQVQLLAPLPRPGKVVGVGRNYADHAKETGVAPFEQPRIIAKLPSSVCAPGSRVLRPAGVVKLDFEIELAVLIGTLAQRVPCAQALAHVAGYSVLDDVSARDFQFDVNPAQTTFAKSMDGFCPMGPWLVSADEIPDPQTLDLRCEINGELMQQGHTADMLFPVARLIEYLSGFMALEPGDVIATGTPAGIGAFRSPPRWLQPGDQVRMEISRIGVLAHSIAALPD